MDGYEIEGTLGVGGMGTVYAARVVATGQSVAIKVLHDELAQIDSYRERFAREVHAMCRVTSPHVVQVLDVVLSVDRPYFVMERLRGRDLRARLAAGPMLLREVLTIGLELVRAIATLHAHAIIHRDLKPSNIFLVEEGERLEVKVLDFGIVKVTDDLVASVTSPSNAMGTLTHMAPEQLLATDQASGATDVWALGVMLYEMLTNAHPFRRPDMLLPSAVLEQPPLSISERRVNVPPGLADLVYRALKKDPEIRLGIDELEEGLTRELANLDASFRPPALFDGEEPFNDLDETRVEASLSPRHSYIREIELDEATTQVDSCATRVASPSARQRTAP